MPFNQQMSFPCELKLVETKGGLRLTRRPVKEIEGLYAAVTKIGDAALSADPFAGVTADALDVTLRIPADKELTVLLRGYPLTYRPERRTVTFLDRSTEGEGDGGPVELRILLDRTSVEVFRADGVTTLSGCIVPKEGAPAIAVQSKDPSARLISAEVHPLKSAWEGVGVR
jgi:sucrose-6-phosphate hydrolase SacC (GH32 family)